MTEDWDPDTYKDLIPPAPRKKKPPSNLRAIKGGGQPDDLGLLTNKEGEPEASLANTISVLVRHRQWAGVIAYDEFAEEVVTLLAPPVRPHDRPEVHRAGDWSDEDSARTVAWIATEIGFSPRLEHVEQAVRVVARRKSFHPVRTYLEGLVWDRKPRLDTWLHDHLGAEANPYSAAVGARWLISAVARVMEPGCKVDCLLVIEGLQGTRKSSALEALAVHPAWFADSDLKIGEKDGYQSLRRKWIYEVSELASLKGAKIEKTKAFISAKVDNYRPSFGRRNRDFLRQVVFAGTTNLTHYLADDTGARRFWPVKCTRDGVAGILENRDQLWAEATARYRLKEPWYVDTPELKALCEAEQEERQIDDPVVDMLAQWLKEPRIKRHEMSTINLFPEEGLLIHEILMGAFEKKASDIRHNDSLTQKVGRQMQTLGWERLRRLRVKDSRRPWAYFPPGTEAARKGEMSQLDMPGT